MNFRRMIVNIFNEFENRLFFLFISFCEAEFADRMTIENSFVCFDDGVMIIHSHRPMIVRNEKGKNLSIEFILAVHRFEKYDKSF